MLIFTEGIHRGLTQAGESFFGNAYDNLIVHDSKQPVIQFNQGAKEGFAEIAQLRMKNWSSTTRWNELADITGLLTELAGLKFFGFTAQSAMAGFLESLQGDRGLDFVWAGEAVDVKGTRSAAQKFKFNRTNRNANRASIIVFCYLQDTETGAFVRLLGWAWRHQLYPWMRQDERYDFVRFETLAREGAVKPIRELKAMAEGEYTYEQV